ncbi:hypothetical protein F5884DRAFT_900999 [Xylogone sp. PMI_703]|nr:hypothetical protein F5884DRAFT_900999 [Xylogone sp. PMI_703]
MAGTLPPIIHGNFIGLVNRYEVPAANLSAFVKLGDQLIALSKTETGSIFLNVGQDIQDHTVFHTQEAWASQDALNAHLQNPPFVEIVLAAEKIGATSVDYQFDASHWMDFVVNTTSS